MTGKDLDNAAERPDDWAGAWTVEAQRLEDGATDVFERVFIENLDDDGLIAPHRSGAPFEVISGDDNHPRTVATIRPLGTFRLSGFPEFYSDGTFTYLATDDSGAEFLLRISRASTPEQETEGGRTVSLIVDPSPIHTAIQRFSDHNG